MKKIKDVIGSFGGGKGGGGSPRVAVEAPNDLNSRAVARVIDLLSEGPIGGLVDGGNSIFFDNTPFQNNFTGSFEQRLGLSSQTYIPGFSEVEAEVSVNTEVTNATPVTRAVSSEDIDAVRVTVRLPEGLYEQNTTNGDINGYTVQIAIDRREEGGIFSQVLTNTITGKTNTVYERSFRVPRPGTGSDGLWEFKVRRVTADEELASIASATFVDRFTEIQEEQLSYNNSAYVGITVDAETTGERIPRRSYLIDGLSIQIPSNYDPVTRVYTGTWDGTFTTGVTNNPAWVLYALLTNERWGLGEYINALQVDKFSFYEAAQYNDEFVDDFDGGTEPRFRFDGVIQTREDAIRVLHAVAASQRAFLTDTGVIRLIQDRPRDSRAFVNNSNVIDGTFNYSSTSLNDRHTQAIVTYNEPAENYLPATIAEEDTASITRFGLNPIEIALIGCTSEGQARRFAKWVVDTETNTFDMVNFRSSFDTINYRVGDVITIVDNDYMNLQASGRVVSGTTTAITLDRAVATDDAPYTLALILTDGTVEERSVTSFTSGDTVANVSSAFSETPTPNHLWYLYGSIVGREFSILHIREEETGIYAITAVEYDSGKYARVEDGIVLDAPKFTLPTQFSVSAPDNFNWFEESYIDPAGVQPPATQLRVSWDIPAGIITGYSVQYRRDSQAFRKIANVQQNEFIITDAAPGVYDIVVHAYNLQGVKSAAGTSTYDHDVSGSSTLQAPTDFYVKGTTDTEFVGKDLTVIWTNHPNNDNTDNVLAGWVIEVYDSTGADLKNTYSVSSAAREFVYLYDYNVSDFGTATREVQLKIYARDTFNRVSTANTDNFTNPAPAAPSFTLKPIFDNTLVLLSEVTDSDFVGYLIHRSETASFTPGGGNLVYRGNDQKPFIEGAEDTTYYWQVTAYDTFGEDDLNYATEQSATQGFIPILNEFSFENLVFTPNDPSTNFVSWTAGSAYYTDENGDTTTYAISSGNAEWTSGSLYVYYEVPDTALSTTTDILIATGREKRILAIYRGGTDLESGNGTVFIDGQRIIAGTVAAGQLVVGQAVITEQAQMASATIGDAQVISLSGSKLFANSVTADEIDANAITADKIAAGAVEEAKIFDGAVINSKLGDLAVDTRILAANAVTTAKIQDSSIVADKIGAGEIIAGKIAANAIVAGDGVIANAAIGTAQIQNLSVSTAKITDLSVNTLKIAGGAVSGGASAYNGGTTTSGNAVSVGISSTGNPVFITASLEAFCQSTDEISGETVTFTLTRGGSGLTSTSVTVDPETSTTTSVAFGYRDSVGPGSQTYAVSVSGTGQARKASIFVMELKK